MPVAKALPRARICIGMTSDMYTHEMGPKEQEKMMETQKRKKTPPMERPRLLPSLFCELMAASQIRAMVMPMVPMSKGLRRPTRSRRKTMKMRSVDGRELGKEPGWLGITYLRVGRRSYRSPRLEDWCCR